VTPTTPIPDGSVIITPTEMYAEMRATHTAVQKIDAKIDGVPQQLADHETRLRAVEKAVWWTAGAAAVLGGAAGALLGH
jgi:hypothetical protein